MGRTEVLRRLKPTLHGAVLFTVLLPAAPPFEPGVLPRTWQTAGPTCPDGRDWQIHVYNADFYVLREPGCTNYEKPFLYLVFGSERALLVDAGAGKPDTKSAMEKAMRLWSSAHGGKTLPLTVTHSHAHGDHVAGDAQFRDQPGVTLIEPTVEAARTGVLLTGDSLYPGRLYVSDWEAFRLSTRRLLEFTAKHPVSHILGCHIEQQRTPYTDYKTGTVFQPDEHALELGRAELLELDEGLKLLGSTPTRAAYRDFTIWPVLPRSE